MQSESSIPRADDYLPAVTGLRGVAALWVLAFHLFDANQRPAMGFGALDLSPWLGSGYLGVDLFFVLSGFLLVPVFIDPRRRAQGLAAFWRHRLRRVLPALWVQILILLTVMAWLGRSLPSLADIAAHLSLTFNLWRNESSINGVYWSLPVEWNFYVVLPLMALAFVGGARRAVCGLLLLLALAIGFRLLCVFAVARYGLDGLALARWITQLPGRLDQFALGMAAGWLLLRHPPSIALARALAWLGLFATLALAALAHQLGSFVGELRMPWVWLFNLLIALAFATLTLGVAAHARSAVARALQWRALAWAGMVSYSLYLWHVPVIQFWSAKLQGPGGLIGAALIGGSSLAVAWLSYRWVERPFLGPRARRSEQRPPAVPAPAQSRPGRFPLG